MQAKTFALEDFDDILSRGRPFGSSDYICQQMQRAFVCRLLEIGCALPEERGCLDTLAKLDDLVAYRAVGDPLVRYAVQSVLRQIEFGGQEPLLLEACHRLFALAAQRYKGGETSGPLEWAMARDPVRLRIGHPTPWIWDEKGSLDNVFGTAFRSVIRDEYGDSLCTPTAEEIAALRKSARLLEIISPQLADSAFRHTHLIAIFPNSGSWRKMASSSQFRVNGVIFLNQAALENPWWVAEHLLHESLHQKLYDFRHAHSLLARDDPDSTGLPDETGMVISPWNSPGVDANNAWDPHRTIAAFHVYVHLAYFCMLAERRVEELHGQFGLPSEGTYAMTRSRTALDRARYLGESLQNTCVHELGLAGRRLVDWLMSILDYIDPDPAPAGTTFHLILDRYLAEASAIRRDGSSATAQTRLAELAKIEAQVAMDVADALGAYAEAERLSVALAGIAVHGHQNMALPETRRVVAEALRKLSPDGYALARKSADEMVTDMVEASSRELARIGAISFRRRARNRTAAA